MDYDSFKDYINKIEPRKRDIANAWKTAIGLQAVDGLKPSKHRLRVAIDNIEGRISMEEAKKRIESYYSEIPNSSKPRRKQIRLKHYDYSQNGYYFITICAKERQCLFGKIENNKTVLSEWGDIAKTEIENIENHYDNVFVDKYVIMPNHIHMIVVIQSSGTDKSVPYDDIGGLSVGDAFMRPANSDKHFNIPNVTGKFKAGVSRKCGFGIWQRGYYEHIIRNEQDYLRIYEYIENNSLKWQEDKYYEQ